MLGEGVVTAADVGAREMMILDHVTDWLVPVVSLKGDVTSRYIHLLSV